MMLAALYGFFGRRARKLAALKQADTLSDFIADARRGTKGNNLKPKQNDMPFLGGY